MDLPIAKKTEDMMDYAYLCLRYYPKSERFVIGVDIRNSMLEFYKMIIGSGKKYHKKTALQNADIELEKLRSLVRLSKSLKFLTFKRYEVWSKYLTEIGSMLGGWLKSVNGRAPNGELSK